MVVGFNTTYTISAYRLWFCSCGDVFRSFLLPYQLYKWLIVLFMLSLFIYVSYFQIRWCSCRFNLRLVVGWCPSRIQPKNIKLVIADSPLSTACSIKELEQRLGWIQNNVSECSNMICLPMDCYFTKTIQILVSMLA